MENQLGSISVLQETLRDSRIGLWCIEMDDGKAPRVYVDDTFREMMDMDAALSPEESYCFWYERIFDKDLEKVRDSIEEMTQGRHAEVLYAWMHPTRGTIYIRCGGTRDTAYKAGLRFRGSHQDVSELARVRMEMERRLEQREREYTKLTRASEASRAILNAIPGGVAAIRYTPDGRWVPEFLSEGFAAMCDMPMEQVWELYRKDAMTGVHPDDQAPLALELERYFSGDRESTELVYRLKRGDRGYFWVRNTLTMIRDEHGVKKIYCVYRDITRELEEREQLRRQYAERLAQHYRAVGPDVLLAGHSNVSQNQLMELVDRTDSNLLQAFGNERDAFFIGLGGFLADEGERRVFLETFLNAPLLAAYSAGETELEQCCFVQFPRDAYGRYVQFKVHLVADPDTGELMGILTVTDVTEQTITRKILGKLSVLGCDLIADVNLYQDCQTFLTFGGVEGVPGRKVSFSGYNKTALRTYVVPGDREHLARMLDPDYILNRLRTADSFSFSYSVRAETGAVLTKHLTISAIDLRLGRVCTARRDITESVEAERQSKEALEQALAAAERASRAKSDFLSSMSHDIRTPMNAIVGMTALAQAHLDDRARLEDCLRKISLSSGHLLSLINDILDMNKIERSMLVLNREEIVLSAVLEQMASMFEAQAQMKHLRLEIRQREISGRAFYGDALRLNQILINLLGNAVKFTPEGGCVELEAEELVPLGGNGRVRLRFTVQDSGVGMSQAFLERLFDPFTRGEAASHVEGSGLGLSIAKGLVDLMGGTISVESRENRGSTFRVELEFDAVTEERKTQPAAAGAEAEELPLSGYRLLAAEDNALNAEILGELLEMKGARLDTRENGALAVEAFREAAPGTYDAILMDVQMPVMNGYEAARAIRALDRPDGKIIPILAMTANAFAEDVRMAMEAGMDAHVAKPIDIDQVVRLLHELVARKKGQLAGAAEAPGKPSL